MLDSLAEIDAKFVKLIDKECEGVSNDLKKWFKKLAVRRGICHSDFHLLIRKSQKEERNHDEKISAANAKVKQAGESST